jgi:hypothetical protein
MKSHTDINQSKKLAEILPLETADMFLAINGKLPVMSKYILDGFVTADATAIPCWSLAALLDVLESEIDGENGETYKLNIEKDGTWWDIWYSEEYNEENPIETTSSEELIDVCYEMILELKKRKLL